MIKLSLNVLTLLLVAYLCAFASLFIFGKVDINIGGPIRILMERWEQPFAQFLVLFAVWLALKRKYNKSRLDNSVGFFARQMGRLRRGLFTPIVPDVDHIHAGRVGGVGQLATILVATALLAGIALRIYHLPLFYFNPDSVINMEMGDKTIAANFLITHSSHSSMGPPHPPMFNYALGLLMTISRDPIVIAGMLSLLNIMALLVFARYMLYSEPLYFAIVSIGLLAVNSSLILYSTMIWHPTLMPVALTLFHVKLCRFIKEKKSQDLTWAFVFAAIAAQFHSSGYFLVLPLAIVAYSFRKEAGAKGLAMALGAGALVCSPYLYYMLVEGGILDGLNTAVGAKREFSMETIERFVSVSGAMLSPRVFAYWLGGHDYDFFIQRDTGLFGDALKMAGYLVEFSFAVGLLRYIAMVASARSFFPTDPSGERMGQPPVSFQLAGLIVLFASVGYILVRTPVFPHYLTFMFPSYVILAAWAPFKLCKYMAGRATALFVIAGHTALAAILLVAMNKAGGNYLAYGATYRTMTQITEAIRQINPENRPLDLYVERIRSQVIYDHVFNYLLPPDWRKDSPNKMPLLLNVTWDSNERKFDWFVKSLESSHGERDTAIQQALALIPKGARLAVYPDVSKYVRGRANTVESQTPVSDSSFEYVLADVRFAPYAPPVNYYAIESAQDMLLDRHYGLIYHSNGILLFKLGAQKIADREEFEKIALTFKSVKMHCGGEADSIRPGSKSGLVRSSLKGKAPKNTYMVCGPYINLAPGQYVATFRLLIEETTNTNPVAMLDVVSDGATLKLGEKRITPDDFQLTQAWNDLDVPFTVGPKGAHGAELRILYLGGPEIQVDVVSISMSDQTFNSMLRN